MAEAKYSAGLMSQSFWFIEFKKIVKHTNDGKSIDEIRALCLEDNLLGISKAYRAKRIYGYIINRVRTLDSTLIKLFCDSDLSTQKLINLITILRTDRLFFEFVYEVYREKVILGIPYMEDSDLGVFFKNKDAQSDDVATWKDTTVKHLKSNYLNYLADANLLSGCAKKYSITPPFVDVALERYLQAREETAILKAITGVR